MRLVGLDRVNDVEKSRMTSGRGGCDGKTVACLFSQLIWSDRIGFEICLLDGSQKLFAVSRGHVHKSLLPFELYEQLLSTIALAGFPNIGVAGFLDGAPVFTAFGTFLLLIQEDVATGLAFLLAPMMC